MEHVPTECDCDFVVYCLAGRAAVSRAFAELPGASNQERLVCVDFGVCTFWLFAYYERRVPELEIRFAGFHCRVFLWMDMAAYEFNFCFGPGARGGGPALAFFV